MESTNILYSTQVDLFESLIVPDVHSLSESSSPINSGNNSNLFDNIVSELFPENEHYRSADKESKRKEQVKNASKMYRQRKKAKSIQLEDALAQSEEKTSQLLKRLSETDKIIEKMKIENDVLKNLQTSNVGKNNNRMPFLKKLLESTTPLSEEIIEQTLEQLRTIYTNEIGLCSTNCLLGIKSTDQLLDNNFFGEDENINNLTIKSSLEAFGEALKEISDLDIQQKRQIDDAIFAKSGKFELFSEQRSRSVVEVQRIFAKLKDNPFNLTTRVEAMKSLEQLRKNIEWEAEAWKDGFQSLLSQLTPIQAVQAQLKLKSYNLFLPELTTIWNVANSCANSSCDSSCTCGCGQQICSF